MKKEVEKRKNSKKNNAIDLNHSENNTALNEQKIEHVENKEEESPINTNVDNTETVDEDTIIKQCEEEIEKINVIEKDLEEKINGKKELNIIEKRLFNDRFTSFWNGHTNGWD